MSISNEESDDLSQIVIEDNDDDKNSEESIQPFNPKDINIGVERLSLDALIIRMQHKEIDLNPDFQRSPNLWTTTKKSRLIESILVRLPLPAFYFDATDDNNWLVIDGLQRLSAIKHFVLGNPSLVLRGLEFLTDEIGKTYENIGRMYQRRIHESQITAYLVRPGTPADVKYSIFKRINTGGLTLNNQEIRNAMAKPAQREFLEDCCANPLFKDLLGDQSKRMLDRELVLRFFAFYKLDNTTVTSSNITISLDEMMETLKNKSKADLEKLQEILNKSLTRCHELLGIHAFEKPTSDNKRGVSKSITLYEVLMVSIGHLSEDEFTLLSTKKDLFKMMLHREINVDTDFFNSLTFATQKKSHVQIRHQKLNKIINETIKRALL